jgi:hypothetical protein
MEGAISEEKLRKVAEGVKSRGIPRLKVYGISAKEKMEEFRIETSIINDEECDELDSGKIAMI